MLLQRSSIKNKQPNIKYDDYLNLESEPSHFKEYKIDPEIEDELLASRFFLKRRVWKNMAKIRRDNVRVDVSHRPRDKKAFKPRQLHMPI